MKCTFGKQKYTHIQLSMKNAHIYVMTIYTMAKNILYKAVYEYIHIIWVCDLVSGCVMRLIVIPY